MSKRAWVYRLRASNWKEDKPETYAITVPPDVGRRHVGRRFTCELTEEGFLYRLLDEQTETPGWLK